MKILIIQEKSMVPGVTTEQLYARWDQLKDYKGIEYKVISLKKRLSTEYLDEILEDYDALFGVYFSKGLYTDELLDKHPKLKYISTNSHGYESLDADLMRRHGITCTNTIYGDNTIAQYAMALLLEICHHVAFHHHYLTHDYFEKENSRYCISLVKQVEILDKTVGIIGLGNIGYEFAKMIQGFGGHVIAYDHYKKEGEKYDFIEQVSLDELLERSDIISMHCPLNSYTSNIISKENIAKMKDGVIFINTARGGLVDEEALLEALNSGKIYACGLDVLVDERPVEITPLMAHENVIVTGHIAWLTPESRLRGIDLMVKNYMNYLEGHPTSVIS